MNKKLTATDIHNSSTENLEKIDKKVKKYAKNLVCDETIRDSEILKYEKELISELSIENENLLYLRRNVEGLNDIDICSHLIENSGIQNIVDETLLEYDDIIKLSKEQSKLVNKLSIIKSEEIKRYNLISSDRKFSNMEDIDILMTIRKMYTIDNNFDPLKLYEKFGGDSNLDYAHELSLKVLSDNSSNILNDLLSTKNLSKLGLSYITNQKVISNKLLGRLLNKKLTTNNSVTILDNSYTNNDNNKLVYRTRTIGELILDITNEENEQLVKEFRHQIYMVTNGLRPSKFEYHNWNGLQVLDIDLKLWIAEGYSLSNLKEQLHKILSQYHWYLCIAFSASKNGLHIYTKVTPPHHIYIKLVDNERMCKYWHRINYTTKYNTLNSILYYLSNSPQHPNIIFEDKFYNKFVDVSVGRITSGIKVTYDNELLVNENFMDLHVGVGLSQTINKNENYYGDNFNNESEISEYLLRTDSKLIKAINRELLEEVEGVKNNLDNVDVSKYVKLNQNFDASKITDLPRKNLNYTIRYNVCNTLAHLYGGDGLAYAHKILNSRECDNENEINAFFSSALSNNKTATKIGLDILKRVGLLKYTTEHNELGEEIINPLLEETDNIFRIELRQAIEKSLLHVNDENDFNLKGDEYLAHIKNDLAKLITGDKINIVLSPPGSGKCLGKNTPILMYDGKIKMVQDVVKGDVIMGWDSTPRNVLSTTTGQEMMYKIKPKNENGFVCNESHILSMVEFGEEINEKTIKNLDVLTYLNLDKNKKDSMRTFRVPVEFEEKQTPETPYDFGLILGDNCFTKKIISIASQKIYEKEFEDIENILDFYIINSKENQLSFLKGLMDSQASKNSFKTNFKVIKNKVKFLAQLLGYNVSTKIMKHKYGEYYKMLFIKQNVFPFSVVKLGLDDYYGFTLDGDKMFCLGDGIVTHNTEYIKTLARDNKRILLVLPYVSVINNKIVTDKSITDLFDSYYGDKDFKNIEYGRNAVTTFDKFSKANYDKLSNMFDYIFIDESHLLFVSQYRVEATSHALKKIKELYNISKNSPIASKVVLLTGTTTGENYFFGGVGNIIKVGKQQIIKNVEFNICGDILDSTTRLASTARRYIENGYKLIIPTNAGEIYVEKIVGMMNYLLGERQIKYGYYKSANKEQEICKLIDTHGTVGDYDIVFCTNYLSVGVDINDKDFKFATLFLGEFSGFEIEQFNARIRKTNIHSHIFITTTNAQGEFLPKYMEEPNLLLRITDDDKANFIDDKIIANSKQEFIAQYDPVLHRISTPGFSIFQGKIQFSIEEYELCNFENKFLDVMSHPIKISRSLAQYGCNVTVSTQISDMNLGEQKLLKKIGAESSATEKVRKHTLFIETYRDLVRGNSHTNENGIEVNNVIDWILKNPKEIIEDRTMEKHVVIEYTIFGQPLKATVKSLEYLQKSIKYARYLCERYTKYRALHFIDDFVSDEGVLNMSDFEKKIRLLKLKDKSDRGELSEAIDEVINKMHSFIDSFETNSVKGLSKQSLDATIENWVYNYLDLIGVSVSTKYGYDKIRDSVMELMNTLGTKYKSKYGIRYRYNKVQELDGYNSIVSIDKQVTSLFKLERILTADIKKNKFEQRHICVQHF